MRKNVAGQMKYQAFNGKDIISVINFLTEFRRACDSSRIHKFAAVRLFRESINGIVLAAIKAQLMLSSNAASRHEGTIKTYAEVQSSILRRYATDAVIVKADEKILNFIQSFLML